MIRLGETNGYAVWATCEEQLHREGCTFFHPAPRFLAFFPPILAVPVHLAAIISTFESTFLLSSTSSVILHDSGATLIQTSR